jgi:ABC-type phosphate/phosphonate transport system substrate-binding protein
MLHSNGFPVLLAGAVGFLLLATKPLHADQPGSAEPVKIGMVQTLFTDVPKTIVDWVSPLFTTLVKKHTGLDGKLVVGGDYYHLSQLLNEKKVQLGVFHGHEFAWAQQKFKDLKPLMIAVYKRHVLRAQLVVREDSTATGFPDFKGKNVALPFRSKGHCRVYLERNCAECGMNDPRAFFSQVTAPANVETALDDVLLGKVQCAVVDDEGLETYGNIKPGCYARLKVLKQSENFPCGIIAYREGALDKAILDRFRDGMIKANTSDESRDIMRMFKVMAFEPVPADYPQLLNHVLQAYPAPETPAARSQARNGSASR